MNILVIGNGFDLAHRLPTKYWHFMMFIKNFKSLEFKTREEMQKLPIFIELNDNVKEYLLKDEVFYKQNRSDVLNELNDLISTNIWIKYFEDKVQDYKDKKWIDFESEIAEIIMAIDYLIEYNIHEMKTNGTRFDKNDEIKNILISDFLSKYKYCNKSSDFKNIGRFDFVGDRLKKVIDDINVDLNGLIRCLEIYLGEVVEKSNIDYRIHEMNELKIDKLISFNYTNTYQRLYESDSANIEIDYLHGNVEVNRDITENNMVLGIDEYLEEEERNKKLDLILFKKYFQRIYKKTGCRHKEWLEKTGKFQQDFGEGFLKKGQSFLNNIYIYGHSLDVTDKDILKDLLEFPYTQITIFYLDKSDYAEKIANVIKIIGQDKLISSVYGETPKIIFRKMQN